jgi:hypothetical protein
VGATVPTETADDRVLHPDVASVDRGTEHAQTTNAEVGKAGALASSFVDG